MLYLQGFKNDFRMKKNILIVEDEKDIVNLIKNRLNSDIYNIDIAVTGNEAFLKVNSNFYDLITLDIMLPNMDGFKLCKEVRKRSKSTLIVMISALDTEEFKIKGYDFGIDDYISKPFSAKELSIKIKSLLKRRHEISSFDSKNISNILINEKIKNISINGFELNLTPSEYLIFFTLLNYKNKIFSRQELAQLIYDSYLGEIDERGIDSHIYHIRKKIKNYEEKELIRTIRGTGYTIHEN